MEINDPRKLKQSEFEALLKRCRKTNMAIYAGRTGTDPDPEIPFSIGRCFGVSGLNKNSLADENALTSLKVLKDEIHQNYIPYTSKALNWHTDGYYNSSKEQIHSMMLHSLQGAASGGENGLMDHEIAYILYNKMHKNIADLMGPKTYTIPKNEMNNREEINNSIFSFHNGRLHMKFSMRERNILWDNKIFKEVDNLKKIIETPRYSF